MKKIGLILLMSFLICGCTNVSSKNYEDIIDEVVSSKVNINNAYRKGYKYYIPRGLRSIGYSEYNEILTNNKYNYYLYVDLVSYFNKVDYKFEQTNSYYSKIFNYQKNNGYLEINNKNDKYLVEMIYNYAKIEVIVDEKDLNETILNAITILSSIDYNRKLINNMIGENILKSNESNYSIFKKNKDDSEFIHYEEIYDNYEEEIPDLDLIN